MARHRGRPSHRLVWGLSLLQTIGWAYLAYHLMTPRMGLDQGPLVRSPKDLVPLLLIVAFYGGIGLVGGVVGLWFAARARKDRREERFEDEASRLRRSLWANLLGFGLQIAIVFVFLLALASVHRGPLF